MSESPQTTWLTQEAHDRLAGELEERQTTRRTEITKRIAAAREGRITAAMAQRGSHSFGHKVATSFFSQNHADELDPARTVLETVEANRIISSTVDYPLHLGVTEAGPPDTSR